MDLILKKVCLIVLETNNITTEIKNFIVIINKKNRTRGVHIYDIYLLYIFDMKGKNNNNTKVIK